MKNLKKFFAAGMLLSGMCATQSFAQYALSGTVEAAGTGEKIPGAVVSVENSFSVAITDAHGNFVFGKLKSETVRINVSHLAFEEQVQEVTLNGSPVTVSLQPKTILAEEVNVVATRAGDKSAVAYTNLSGNEIEKQNLGQDLPYLLNLTPSVVVTSDAGAGIGYTGIRIRGSDPTRVNVTINGVPVNDAEGQLVYWVDLPDFASSVDNLQVQRGIGTSTNGAGAFGGSVNIQSGKSATGPSAFINSSYGSFNTIKNTVRFGSGILNNHFSLEGRLSKITSDGYIDRAASDLKSFYLSGGYYDQASSLKLIVFSGKEKTYQAWYGVPEDSLATNRTFNPAGLYYDDLGNIHYYDNQTDNYQQDYYQLLYTRSVSSNWNVNAALHYTKGKGYYEEYVQGDYLSSYGITPILSGTDTLLTTDLIRQRWLDNDFYGFTFSSNYDGGRMHFTFGGAGNRYLGKHFDEIIWMQKNFSTPYPYRYSDNHATKNDVNFFAAAGYELTSRLSLHGDLQVRNIRYSFLGIDENFISMPQEVHLSFFNPKGGVSFTISAQQELYASYSIGHKEPVRDDYVNAPPSQRPKPEMMQDVEAGYKFRSKKFQASVNYYLMYYKDQLVLTGKIDDVGNYIRANVDRSYRTGAELEVSYIIRKEITMQGNVTFSRNKIKAQVADTLSNTDISFSPPVIAAATVLLKPFRNFEADVTGKFVGKQYLDNTSGEDHRLKPYLLNNILLKYAVSIAHVKEAAVTLTVNNIFNTLYESNGYIYSYLSGSALIAQNYYYPQAGINWLAGLTLRF